MDILEQIMAWEREEGPVLFRRMGVAQGATVVDFGAGQGHFAVAAAYAVGSSGKVLALDRDEQAVDALCHRATTEGITSIEPVITDGSLSINLPDGSVDFVMYYDILHMLGLNRATLIAEARRVLKPGGVLSVLPFHMDEVQKRTLIHEIMATGFESPVLTPGGLHCGMLHQAMEDPDADFNEVERGDIYNFTIL